MKYEFDPRKAAANLARDGVAFDAAEGFDWDTAQVRRDARRDYGEDRFTALGIIGGRLYVMIFTTRGARVRIIGLRRANPRERRAYARHTETG